jgi:hypothetical protein
MIADPQIGQEVIFITRHGHLDSGTIISGQGGCIRLKTDVLEHLEHRDWLFRPDDHAGIIKALKSIVSTCQFNIERLEDRKKKGKPVFSQLRPKPATVGS